MGKSSPTPPPAPDYAAANREAVQADIDTLPMRRLIEAQARLGQGQFQGLGDADLAAQLFQQQIEQAPAATQALLDLQKRFGTAFAEEARNQLQATDPGGFALRDNLASRLLTGNNSLESLVPSASTTAPDYAAYVRNNPDLLANWQNNTSKNTGLSIEDYGKQHYEANGRQEGRSLPTSTVQSGVPQYEKVTDGSLPTYGRLSSGPIFSALDAGGALSRIGNGPELSSVTYNNLDSGSPLARLNNAAAMDRVASTNLADTGATAAGRSLLEQQIFDELAKAGTSDPVLQRAAEQAARVRGVSSGQLYGGANALQESMAVQLAQKQQDDARRSNALSLLNSGQSTSDTANRLAQENFANRVQAAGFNNAANQQDYSNAANTAQFNNAAQQQELLNRNAATSGNNAAQLAATGFNNAAAQQGYQNQGTAATFNNAAAQQELANRNAATAGNNSNAQQGYQNQATTATFNNSVTDQQFQNVMAAIGQRNQANQNQFAANQGNLQQRSAARQQDLANIQSFLGLTPIVSQGGQLAGLQQGAAPFVQNSYSGANVNNNAGQLGTGFAANIFGTEANIYNTQMQNASSPFATILGTGLGAFAGGYGKALGAKAGCHVAREVYGTDNPEWVVFYHWKENVAPGWFRKAYNAHSKWVADAIRPFPAIKSAIRSWMNSKIYA